MQFLELDESSDEDEISNEFQSDSSKEDTFVQRTTDTASFSNELGVSDKPNDTMNERSIIRQENSSTTMTLGDDSIEESTSESINATLPDSEEDTTTDMEMELMQNGKIYL